MVEDEFGNPSTTEPVVRQKVLFTELLERQCPIYMAMGMTYDEYWNDDVEKAVYYRRAFKLKKKQKNHWLWLQGAYVYRILQNIYPLYNAWAQAQPEPYLDFPIPLDAQEEKETENERMKRQMMEMQDYMERQMARQQKGEDKQ